MRFILKIVLLVAILAGLNAVIDKRVAGMMMLNTALKLQSEHVSSLDVPYGKHAWQKLDVLQPTSTTEKSPVLIFLHGGGWHWGSKDLYYFAADAFARLGYVVVLPDYIKYPEGRFPSFIEDGAQAVAWTKQYIQQYGGDPSRIFLSGHSAGAHTAALLATDKRYLNAKGLSPQDIKGFAGISGPYNFTPKWQQYIDTFGKENFTEMKANHHVDGDEPPMLLIHSEGDTAVGQFNQQMLFEKSQAQGNQVETILYGQEINHITIMMKLHPWFAEDVDVAKDIHHYFEAL